MSTPKSAFEYYLRNVDIDAVEACRALYVDPESAEEAEYLKKFFTFCTVTQDLRKAADKTYGPKILESGWFDYTSEFELQDIRQAKVEFPPYFETAVVYPRDDPTGYHLIRGSMGAWQLRVSNFTRHGQALENLDRITQTMRAILDGIKAQRYQNEKELLDDMQRHVWDESN